MSLLLNQVRQAIARSLIDSGIDNDLAETAASAAIQSVQSEFAGDRVYIAKSKELELKARNRAIIRDWRAGERVPLLSRRYGVSIRHIRRIVAG